MNILLCEWIWCFVECRPVTRDKSAYVHVAQDRTKAVSVCLLRVILKNNLVVTMAEFLLQGHEGGELYLIAGQEFTSLSHLVLSGSVGEERGG